MEDIFDKNDKYIKQKIQTSIDSFAKYDHTKIGTYEDPKLVCINRCCTAQEREHKISLLTKYKDFFTWYYMDLKRFMNGKLQHHIHLKPGTAPFRMKQWSYNPKIVDAIFNKIDKMLKEESYILYITLFR